CRELLADPSIDLRLVATDLASRAQSTEALDPWLEARLSRAPESPPDVQVRHQWPPNFEPPAAGHLVIIQPWEFVSLPASWIEPLNRLADEVWVPSRFVQQCFVRSGVQPERVLVVPNGVDPATFRPGLP